MLTPRFTTGICGVSDLWCGADEAEPDLFRPCAEGHKPVSTVETLGENLNMAWSSDGKTIVIGNRNDKVVWVDVEEQKITRRIDMGKDVSLSPADSAFALERPDSFRLAQCIDHFDF